MKKIFKAIALAGLLLSCQKQQIKPSRETKAKIQFTVGKVHQWSESGIDTLVIKVDGFEDYRAEITNAPGYNESPCNSFSFTYRLNTSKEVENRYFSICGDREILAEGYLVFSDSVYFVKF